MNMGAYLHVQPRLQRCMEVRRRSLCCLCRTAACHRLHDDGWVGRAHKGRPYPASCCPCEPPSHMLVLPSFLCRPLAARCRFASSTAAARPWRQRPQASARCMRRSRWAGPAVLARNAAVLGYTWSKGLGGLALALGRQAAQQARRGVSTGPLADPLGGNVCACLPCRLAPGTPKPHTPNPTTHPHLCLCAQQCSLAG